jgi:DNA polymerase/3'-5' exonuclease PolX
MKFYELLVIFQTFIKDVKINNKENPSLSFIISAYNNVLTELNNTFKPNENITDDKINNTNLTTKMKNKLIELLKLKITKKMETEIKSLHKHAMLKKDLDSLLGIGEKKANKLIEKGLTNIKQLHLKKWFSQLNTDTQMILVHNPLRYIPHDDIAKIEKIFTNFGKDIVLVGSYRRNKPFSRDIDILFKQTTNTIDKFIKYLEKKFNNIWIYANGDDKVSFIFCPHSDTNIKYKADIFISSENTFYSNLLYTTGSKNHNIKMRAKARKMGYLLNQNGIFKNGKKINKPQDKEEELFKILDMPYVEPHERF